MALLVSGGHTILLHAPAWGEYHLLGETRDDAAGEAFDKVAKLLGLPYPGGPAIQALGSEGDETRHRLPRPMLRSNQRPGDADFYDFSFSGLKTAVATLVSKLDSLGTLDDEREHVAASFQATVVEVLTSKTLRAVEETGCSRVAPGGWSLGQRTVARRAGPTAGCRGDSVPRVASALAGQRSHGGPALEPIDWSAETSRP